MECIPVGILCEVPLLNGDVVDVFVSPKDLFGDLFVGLALSDLELSEFTLT